MEQASSNLQFAAIKCDKHSIKLLLHPIVRLYTSKCAANIVEKYDCSLLVG